MSRFLALLCFLVAGCHNWAAMPRQDEALGIAWYSLYGERHDPPPIEWLTGSQLNCPTNPGAFLAHKGYLDGPEDSKQCLYGVYWEVPDITQIADRIPESHFGRSAFCHELWHAHLYYTTGSGNADHSDAGFKAGGIVSECWAAMAAAGL